MFFATSKTPLWPSQTERCQKLYDQEFPRIGQFFDQSLKRIRHPGTVHLLIIRLICEKKKLHLEFCKIQLFLFWRRSSQKMLRSSFQMENILVPEIFFTKIQKAVISHFGIFKENFDLILVWSLFLALQWQKVDHFISQVSSPTVSSVFCWAGPLPRQVRGIYSPNFFL